MTGKPHEECIFTQAIKSQVAGVTEGGHLLGAPSPLSPQEASRIIRLEERSDTHEKSLKSMSEAISNLATVVGEQDVKMNDRILKTERNILAKLDDTNQRSQITWPFIISVLIFLLFAFGTAGTLVMLTLEPVKNDIASLKIHDKEHASMPGHLYAIAEFAAHDERIKAAEKREDVIVRMMERLHTQH